MLNRYLLKNLRDILTIYQIFKRRDRKKFEKSTKCWICNEFLKDDKVKDHCHCIGKFRGAAHNNSNLQMKKQKFLSSLS